MPALPLNGTDEPSPVWRLHISHGPEQRLYVDCWVQMDRTSFLVHIWLGEPAGAPDVTAPLASTLIEWARPGNQPRRQS